ncbi:MAG TPA: carbohydrate kinase family protein [Firmicutes bacterium]|nr:carbohydrate kinase family protein [Bacillota bacterium]
MQEAAGHTTSWHIPGAVVEVVGNYNIDLVMAHLDDLPAWGTEATVTYMDPRTAGAAGYSAMALARLGLSPLCIGTVGDDAYGRQIRDELASAGAIVDGLLTTPGVKTGLGVALVRSDGQRAFVTYTGHLDYLDVDSILAAEAAAGTRGPGFAATRYVLLTGYFLLPALGYEGTRLLLERWKSAGKTILFDTGWDPKGWDGKTVAEVKSLLQLVDIFLPNEDEGRALTGEEEPEGIARALAESVAGPVVLKLGPRGSLVFTRGEAPALGEASTQGQASKPPEALMRGKPLYIPGIPASAFDTTGAGDSFNAGVIYGLVNGWPWARILRFANQLGAIVISQRANRFPTAGEVECKLGRAQAE